MKYDFETLVDRSNCGSGKWNEMYAHNPDLPRDIVPFSVADMEFKNAPEIIDGLKNFLDTHILGYTSPTPDYYETVCSWMERHHGWKIAPEEIVSSPGVVPALFMLIAALCKKGDGVMIMTPVYYPFYGATETNGCVVKACPLINTNGDYTIDFDLAEKIAAEEDTKVLIFCNPHNPVGRVWKPDEMKRLGEICRKHHVKIISDEIHSDIIMPGHKHTPFAMAVDFGDEIITCTAPSKTFNLAAMQTSNIILPNPEDRKAFVSIKSLYCVESMNALGFESCRLAYTRGEPWMKEMLSVVYENYRYTVDFLEKNLPMIHPSPLEGTYLLWLDCRELGLDKDALETLTKDKAMLYLDEGYVFGDRGIGFERVNLACPKHVLAAALERLKRAVEEK